jgi:UDP-N-acetylglucosamine--N-acetylmuramyl-(pentapeptide) pyrophosphoryl-undecaprenol N-acetylglucosamine transferase
MKILFTGGGSGGHFYPIISVAKEIQKIAKENRLLAPKLYFVSDTPYNEALLYDNDIIYKKNSAGKRRLYFSILNFLDLFRTGWGIITAFWTVFNIYPDVVFSKGGYASFPVVTAARFFRIPIIIHESDTVPGRVNAHAGKFATRVAVSFEEAARFFPKEKVAVTGNPVREEITQPMTSGAHEFLKLDPNIPTILVLGGSLGAQLVNNIIVDSLSELVQKYQIIHQTGKNNFAEISARADAILFNNRLRARYKPFDYLNESAMRMAAGVASIVISRAGSSIFEIASWGKPSILIPITVSNGDHQRKNAYAYARTKAAVVLEESNVTPHILLSEIDRILTKAGEKEAMSSAAKNFFKPNAAHDIAQEILSIAIKHES